MRHENDRVEDKGESEAENDPCEESREDELISGDERKKSTVAMKFSSLTIENILVYLWQ